MKRPPDEFPDAAVQYLVDTQPLQRNPEQDVVDDIDRLVTESMKAGMRHQHDDPSPLCPVCGSSWHGLRGDGNKAGKFGCPGEYGTQDEKDAWKRHYGARQARSQLAARKRLEGQSWSSWGW